MRRFKKSLPRRRWQAVDTAAGLGKRHHGVVWNAKRLFVVGNFGRPGDHNDDLDTLLVRKKPTITDVARLAEVSVGTVSNVLNKASRVSPTKRARVEQAVLDLGYAQNTLAQNLRRRNSSLIGLCVPFTTISYFSALVDAFEEVASSRGFEIMQVLSRQDPVKELQRVKALLSYQVGGIMILPSGDPSASLALIEASRIPAVVIDRPVAGGRFDQVTFDNRAAMLEAGQRLIGLGHRRILFIVRQRHLSITQIRIKALRKAAAAAAEPVEVKILECSYEEAAFISRLDSELGSPGRPTAIIVSNSTLAAWTLRVLNARCLACPDAVSLLAFDETEWADLVQPSLSVIRQPTRAIALTAWEFLINRMSGDAETVQEAELKAEVVLRDSVGRAPGAPPVARRARHRLVDA
jgi:LacI family transcriptional regulator